MQEVVQQAAVPWPGWIILSALIGALSSLIGVFFNHRLTARRELERFRINAFERYRNEFFQRFRSIAEKIAEKGELDTAKEIEDLVGFYDEIGLYAHRGLIDMELLDEILGDYILEAYHNVPIMQHVLKVRMTTKDESYYVYFVELAKQLEEKAKHRQRR